MADWKYRKIPKIAFTYWAGPLTRLHYLSIRSAIVLNPDWEIRFYQPTIEYKGANTWSTPEHRIKYTGPDYRKELKQLESYKNFKILTIDLASIGFRNDVPEVFKSNYTTYYYLSKDGGVWFDTDVLFLKPLKDLDLNNRMIIGTPETVEVVISYSPAQPKGRRPEFKASFYSTGVLMGSPNNPFYNLILQTLLQKFDPKVYMSATNFLYPFLFKNLQQIHTRFPKLHYANLGMDIFYPYIWSEMNILFYSSTGMERIGPQVIGIHWYNGAQVTERFLNENNYNSNNLIIQLLRQYNLLV